MAKDANTRTRMADCLFNSSSSSSSSSTKRVVDIQVKAMQALVRSMTWATKTGSKAAGAPKDRGGGEVDQRCTKKRTHTHTHIHIEREINIQVLTSKWVTPGQLNRKDILGPTQGTTYAIEVRVSGAFEPFSLAACFD